MIKSIELKRIIKKLNQMVDNYKISDLIVTSKREIIDKLVPPESYNKETVVGIISHFIEFEYKNNKHSIQIFPKSNDNIDLARECKKSLKKFIKKDRKCTKMQTNQL